MKYKESDFSEKIRNKMLLKILLAAGGVLILLTIITLFIARDLLLNELKEKSEHRVALSASYIENWFHEKGTYLEILGDIISENPDGKEFDENYFAKALRKNEAALTIYMGFADGKYIDGAGWKPPPDYDARERPWYLETLINNKLTFTSPYLEPGTNKIVVTIAVPVRSEGKLIGVLAMDILIDTIIEIMNNLKIGNSRSYLVDENGTYITYEYQEMMLKENIRQSKDNHFFASYMAKNVPSATFKGEDYVVFNHIPTTHWQIIFHLPFSEVNKPLQRLYITFTLGLMLTVLVLSITISWISSLIARPIFNLVGGVKDVASGNYESKVKVLSLDEIGFLSHTFNEMADGLKDREFIKSTFGRYVSQEVMEDILNGNISLGGEKKIVTILFSDIRNFTTISEGMDPASVVTFLNDYFTIMDQIISENGGFVNKYLGDGILAVFGAPRELDNSALSAVSAAESMLKALNSFNQIRLSNTEMGVGIHTGEALIGNIGSKERTEYTVIGDSVNLTSRIESLTKIYGQSILISDKTKDLLPDFYCSKMIDRVRVKGKRETVGLFTPCKIDKQDNTSTNLINESNKVMELYFNGEFEEALKTIQNSKVLSKDLEIIKNRCAAFIKNPPENWDGFYTLLNK